MRELSRLNGASNVQVLAIVEDKSKLESVDDIPRQINSSQMYDRNQIFENAQSPQNKRNTYMSNTTSNFFENTGRNIFMQ